MISNLRLQVNQAAEHAATKGDPGAASPLQGYAAHYCNIPTRVDPTVVACSFIASGLRVFDISSLTAPKEIAYYVAPTVARAENFLMASDFAMSQPAFAEDRHEIWYSDGASGFNVLRVDPKVWPQRLDCSSRRRFTATLRLPRGGVLQSATATLRGRRLAARHTGRSVSVTVDLRGVRRLSARLVIRATLRDGRVLRSYHPCRPRA
ncbi:hypothetical protein NBH00_11025 [Paraconexibacter antarcticus]|uniref:Uncharacterized protein n=1 Tax=Paraconexibacter antarcticus TaxID=2949664 RepID=A0ABY5DZF9_9ACTN|nr:hypothetical protein [Paraconexibacter antarcticus]UTI66718.1 hypothetical protein NBH00_11025 [Paraconexibacter antarcticus]